MQAILILDHGCVLYDGTLAELNERFESDWSLVVTFEGEYTDPCLPGLPAPLQEGSRTIYRFDHRKMASAELNSTALTAFSDYGYRGPPPGPGRDDARSPTRS